MSNAVKLREKPATAQTRRCLLCRGDFPSEGPHNRICRRCKGTQVWRQG